MKLWNYFSTINLLIINLLLFTLNYHLIVYLLLVSCLQWFSLTASDYKKKTCLETLLKCILIAVIKQTFVVQWQNYELLLKILEFVLLYYDKFI